MKICSLFGFIALFLLSGSSQARWLLVAMDKVSEKVAAPATQAVTKKAEANKAGAGAKGPTGDFLIASSKVKSGDLEQAAIILEKLTKSGSRAQRMKATYLLGQTLLRMGLHQAAAFKFLSLTRAGKGRYFSRSLSQLFLTADYLDSESFLKYSIVKIVKSKNSVSKTQAFKFRYGEFLVQRKKFKEAAKILSDIQVGYKEYSKAKFLQALAYAETKQEPKALVVYQQLLKFHAKDPVDSYNLNVARAGAARMYYQRKSWSQAIDFYRRIPKDSEIWHEVLFEMSWAHLRAGEFREALGVLSSVHSAFYEDYFLPESTLVRALVYLQICQDDELKKALGLFKQVYTPMRRRLGEYLKSTSKYSKFYEDAKDGIAVINEGTITDEFRKNALIPVPIIQTLTRSPEIKRVFRYMQNLRSEQQTFMQKSEGWKSSSLGKDIAAQTEKRVGFAKKSIGRLIRKHLQSKRVQFANYFRQYDFISYEMSSSLKKRAHEGLVASPEKADAPPPKPSPRVASVDEGLDREFFSAKGIEYWPFQGEYWLDEIGNYHFLGKSLCEKKLQ